LPPGFVRCLLTGIEKDGFVAVEYICPGCGVEQIKPIWIADYPFRPAGVWVAHQFSERYDCRGVFGDCSLDEGILRLGQKPTPAKPKTHKQLQRELVVLGHLLGAYSRSRNPRGHNCQHPPYRHAYPSARYNGACAVWAKQVRADRKALAKASISGHN